MPTSRAQAVAYLDAVLGSARDLAGVAPGDWDVPVDDALLALGQAVDAEPYAGNVIGYRALMRWAGWSFLADRLADQVDNGNPEGNARWSQAWDHAVARLAAAAELARPYAVAGELVTGGAGAYGVRIAHQHDVYATVGW